MHRSAAMAFPRRRTGGSACMEEDFEYICGSMTADHRNEFEDVVVRMGGSALGWTGCMYTPRHCVMNTVFLGVTRSVRAMMKGSKGGDGGSTTSSEAGGCCGRPRCALGVALWRRAVVSWRTWRKGDKKDPSRVASQQSTRFQTEIETRPSSAGHRTSATRRVQP